MGNVKAPDEAIPSAGSGIAAPNEKKNPSCQKAGRSFGIFCDGWIIDKGEEQGHFPGDAVAV